MIHETNQTRYATNPTQDLNAAENSQSEIEEIAAKQKQLTQMNETISEQGSCYRSPNTIKNQPNQGNFPYSPYEVAD